MLNHLDTVFSPRLYLDRDKKAFAFVADRLLHQESCAAVCMYGNGKDYLFTNVVKHFEKQALPHKLKVLNTISSDELKDFADMLEDEAEPTMCMVNLRVRKDVSWFIERLQELRIKRGYAFVSFVCTYVGDIYGALLNTESSINESLVILKRFSDPDAHHIIVELAERFGFNPNDTQEKDILKWSCGHVGLLRSLYLLKRQDPDRIFSKTMLLHEPTVLDRLNNIVRDVPPDKVTALLKHDLSFVEKMFFEAFGYIDETGALFHPLLAPLIPKAEIKPANSALSLTEARVLDYLREHSDTVVSRDDIAKIVWGEEEWEDKYSDWAIGQLIYRLRKKLEYASQSGTVETLKGQGFLYRPVQA